MPVSRVSQPVLVWEREGAPPREFPIGAGGPFTIGRDPGNRVHIDAVVVSKSHARIRPEAGEFVLEDLGSSNGTRLNNNPVATSVLTPGDIIEIGGERLRFVDRATTPSTLKMPAFGKSARLAAAALGTLVVMGGVLMALRPPSAASGGTRQDPQAQQAAAAAVPIATGAGAAGGDDAAIQEIVARAEHAGVPAADALYDEATLQYSLGRLRDAANLFSAVLKRDPRHALAQARLTQVSTALGEAIAYHAGEAERAFAELRYSDAIVEWESVLQLADKSDPRAAAARTGIDLAQTRKPR
jgi:hypothetical protein